MIPIWLGRILSIIHRSPFLQRYPQNRLTGKAAVSKQQLYPSCHDTSSILEHLVSKHHKTQVVTATCLYLEQGKRQDKNPPLFQELHAQRGVCSPIPVKRNKPTASIFACITHKNKRLQTPLHPQTPSQRIRFWCKDSSVLRRTYQCNYKANIHDTAHFKSMLCGINNKISSQNHTVFHWKNSAIFCLFYFPFHSFTAL